jgi:hypothetical protein
MNHILNWFKGIKEGLGFRQGRTVRTMFSWLSIATLLGLAAVTGTDSSYIKLVTSTTVIEAGQQFEVDVYANAVVPVNAVDVTLNFDANDVEVTGVDRGQSVITIWTEDPVIEKDKVILRGGTYRKGFIGEHKIATINLRAKQTGESTFTVGNIMLLAGDGKGTPVKVADSTQSRVSLYIYDENTDPADITVAASISIVTDIDGDGKVSLKDISAFMAAWSSKKQIYDFNGDGKMSFRDFSIILADFFLGV